jgi:hypothetical protein
MNWLFIAGALFVIVGTFWLCGDSKAIVGFAERHRLRPLLTVALCDFGLPRYRRYVAGIALNVMALILLLLAATGHRAEP